MHSRHRWLVESKPVLKLREEIRNDPDYYDPKIAGWWCWGICLWIGSGWCSQLSEQVPRLHHDQALNCKPPKKGESPVDWAQRPEFTAKGIVSGGRPQLGDAYSRGRGVHSNDSANTCEERREFIERWLEALSDRLRNVRVCCGDWSRICSSDTVTTRLGVTGIFLDPPYRVKLKSGKKNRDAVYSTDKDSDLDKLNDGVRDYCLEKGKDKDMRIALCSYEGEGNEILESEGWTVFAWKSNGYGNSAKGKENAARERIWFSPHCVIPERDLYPLFGDDDDGT